MEQRTAVASWVPASLALELRARADAGERSVSAEIRRVLKEHLQAGERHPLSPESAGVSVRGNTGSGVAPAGSTLPTERTR